MSSKARIAHLLIIAKAKKDNRKSSITSEKFMAAWDRGMILCKDGKERTEKEWIAMQPPYLQQILNEIIGEPTTDLSS